MSSSPEYKTPERKRVSSADAKRRRMATQEGAEAIRAYNRRYADDNRERLNELNRNQYARRRARIQLQRKGIDPTPELVSAIDQHDGRCDLCGGEPDGRWKSLSIDHCHATTTARGMLCTRCNTGLGNFKDDPALLAAAIAYLTAPPLRFVY